MDDSVLMIGLVAFGLIILCVMVVIVHAGHDDDEAR